MNREETKKAIEIMQAYVDGRDVEYRYDGGSWELTSREPRWLFALSEYRIKSEPKRKSVENDIGLEFGVEGSP